MAMIAASRVCLINSCKGADFDSARQSALAAHRLLLLKLRPASREFKRTEGSKMLSINKRVFAGLLSLALLFAIVSPASAQWRRRDRGLSTGEKAGIIGGGAAAGAIIGGLLGGKKGAVVGGLLGAGGGGGYVYYKGRQERDRYGYYGDNRYRYRDYRYRNYRDDRYRNYDYNRYERSYRRY